MKLSCGIVCDLLPLYLDGVAGEESNAAVKEHLEECEECLHRYEKMKTGGPVIPSENGHDVEAAKCLKRMRRTIRIRYLLAVVVTAAVLIFGGKLAVNHLIYGVSAQSGEIEVVLERQPDCPFVMHITIGNGKALNCRTSYVHDTDGSNTRIYVYPYAVRKTKMFQESDGFTLGVHWEESGEPSAEEVIVVYADKTVTYHVEEEAEKLK